MDESVHAGRVVDTALSEGDLVFQGRGLHDVLAERSSRMVDCTSHLAALTGVGLQDIPLAELLVFPFPLAVSISELEHEENMQALANVIRIRIRRASHRGAGRY